MTEQHAMYMLVSDHDDCLEQTNTLPISHHQTAFSYPLTPKLLTTSMMPTEQDPDSSEDEEYVPPPDDGSGASDSGGGEPNDATKSPRSGAVDEVELKRARQELWNGFQDSITKTPQAGVPATNMVKIEKRHRFAGEDVVEIVEVAQDSPDVTKWPIWKPPGDSSPSLQDQPPIESQTSTPLSVSGPSDPPIHNTDTKPPGKRPGPRKPKTSLAMVPNTTQKAKKLTTLDKSAMDWRAHLQAEQASGVQDELEANRRSGGYLEKTAFLKRVDERKDDVFQASRSSKRRRL